MASTHNYGWVKPDVGASNDVWGAEINNDLDGIDATIKSVSDSIPSGVGTLSVSDGTHTVTGTTNLSVSGATVGGATPNATLTITGGGGGGGLGAGDTPVFSKRYAAQTAIIPSSIALLRTQGRWEPDDGGAANYYRAASIPKYNPGFMSGPVQRFTVGSNYVLSNTVPVTLTEDIPAGSCIVITAWDGSVTGTNGSVSDVAGNVYLAGPFHPLNGINAQGSATSFYCLNCNALKRGDLVTYFDTAAGPPTAGAGNGIYVFVTFITGVSALDIHTFTTGNSNTPSVSGTPTVAGEMAIAFVISDNSPPINEPAGWTGDANVSSKLGTSTAPFVYNPTTTGTFLNWTAIMLSFTPAVPYNAANYVNWVYQQQNRINAAVFGAKPDPTGAYDSAPALQALGQYIGTINPGPIYPAVGISIGTPAIITPNLRAAFTGVMTALGVLTVSSITYGAGNIAVGQYIAATGLNGQLLGIKITGDLGGAGGAGNYQTNSTQALGSRLMTAGDQHTLTGGQPITLNGVTAGGMPNGLYWVVYTSETISTVQVSATSPWDFIQNTPGVEPAVATTGSQPVPATMNVMAEDWIEWELSRGNYHFGSNPFVQNGAKKTRAFGYGAIVDRITIGQGGGFEDLSSPNPFVTRSAVLFQTMTVGNFPNNVNYIQLVNPSDASLFKLNCYVGLVCNNIQGGGGFPQNAGTFEWVRTQSIDTVGGFVYFYERIKNSYRDSLPYYNQTDCNATGGPATALIMSPGFDFETEIYGFASPDADSILGGCKAVTVDACKFPTGSIAGIQPSACIKFRARNIYWISGFQLDKLIDSCEFEDVDIWGFGGPQLGGIAIAGSTNKLILNRVRIGAVDGAVKSMTIRDSDIGSLFVGSSSGGLENMLIETTQIAEFSANVPAQNWPATAFSFNSTSGVLSIRWDYFKNGLGPIDSGIAFAYPGAKMVCTYSNYAESTCGQPFSIIDARMGGKVVFTGSIDTSGLLTVTAVASGTLAVGTILFDTNINNQVMAANGLAGVVISSLGTGTGGIGTYHLSLSPSAAVPSQSMWGALTLDLYTDLSAWISSLVATGTWTLTTGGVLNVGAMTGSGNIIPGPSLLTGAGVLPNTYITAQLTGATPGGTGTYQTSGTQVLGATTMTATAVPGLIPIGPARLTVKNSGGCARVSELSRAPDELPPFSYFRAGLVGPQDSDIYTTPPVLNGALTSLEVDVKRGSSAAGNLTITFPAYNAALQKVTFSQVINLNIAGKRTIGPTNSGGQTGDTLTAFSGWIGGRMTWLYTNGGNIATMPKVTITGLADQGVCAALIVGGISALSSGFPMTLADTMTDL